MVNKRMFNAILLPVIEMAVFLPLVLFCLLLSLAFWGLSTGIPFGWFLLILTMPGVARFFVIVLESTATGRQPRAFDAEFFRWSGGIWSIFPLPIVAILAWCTWWARTNYGFAGSTVGLIFSGLFLPPFLVVLAITHSVVQSLNPLAIFRLLARTTPLIFIASLYLMVVSSIALLSMSLPLMANVLVQLVVFYSFSSFLGALIRPFGLFEDIYIPDAEEPGEDEIHRNIEEYRSAAISHAYGFVSRGNRSGGFRHIFECIEKDADPVAAWRWYFDKMLKWDDPEAALFFAQDYLHDMLAHGEKLAALKLILHCRLIDDRWKPRREDMPAAINAAKSSGNNELLAVLKRL